MFNFGEKLPAEMIYGTLGAVLVVFIVLLIFIKKKDTK